MTASFDSLLDRMSERLPPASKAGPGEISTRDVLVELAAARAEPTSLERHRQLEALCRKVHVAGKVRAAYTAAWRRKPGARLLSKTEQGLLAGVLLAYSSPLSGPEEELGRALKYLNAALTVLDRLRTDEETEYVSTLEERATEILADVAAAGR